MPPTRPTLLLPQNSFPTPKPPLLNLLLFLALSKIPLNSNFRRMIPIEKRSIDFNTRDFAACNAQTDYYPVEGFRVVATRFPAIVPGACVDEVAGFADGGCGSDEVGGGGEPFV